LAATQDGSDNLYGRGGNDQLYGGNGDDHIDGGVGADLIDGGSGFDTVYYTQASSGVRVNLAGTLPGTGDAAGDILVSIEKVVGSSYADDLYGDQGNNTLVGGAGNDWLSGRDGNDSLYGGAGIDVFVVAPNNGWDIIFDFQDNIDKIDLRAWGVASISQAVSYIADTGPDLRFDFSDGSHLTVLNVANFTDLANDILIA
jgi:Ca2+-binding RTX toxin-like protein